MGKHLLKKSEEGKSGINISPLIDMVFILLVFFIVTTVFVDERGMRTRISEIGPLTVEEPVSFTVGQITRSLLRLGCATGIEVGLHEHRGECVWLDQMARSLLRESLRTQS